ncbi:MAG: hypothetical protein H7258_14430 [Ferruginibacter sp.]|nr:hypothetical protein [Ferruginibacter sp.]
MKKILFIALSVAAFSNLATAQEAAVSAKRAPVENQQATKARAESAAKANLSRETPAKPAAGYSAKYKKAGATQAQSAVLAESMRSLDKRKTDVENNMQLTAEEKKKGLEAVEVERTAVLEKSMGEVANKKHNQQKESKPQVKPAKSN